MFSEIDELKSTKSKKVCYTIIMVGGSMNSDIFISIGFDTAIKKYVLFTEKKHTELATDYFVYVIMMLSLIYSKTDIMNPYLARYNNGASVLRSNMLKYGLAEDKLHKFFSDLNYFLEIDNYNKVYGKYKNPYFLFILEDLVDMFIAKCKTSEVSTMEKTRFRGLLYSAENSNPTVRKINAMYNTSVNGALRYYDAQVSKDNFNLSFIPKKRKMLDIRVYQFFGISLAELTNINNDTLEEINNGIYNYFHINPIGIRADDNLLNKMERMSNTKFKLSNNSGSVNLLLFVSFFLIIILCGIGIGLILI